MNRKKILIASLIAAIALAPLLAAQADEKGVWVYYTYKTTIPVGEGYYHECNHAGAQDAYATVTKASGDYTLDYEWDSPTLRVWISNDDTVAISVTWREYFYEN